MRDLANVIHVEYPWSPYYKFILRFLLSKISSLCYQLCQLFKMLTYTQVQDHDAGQWPIGSLNTIHTIIPAIIITVLDMEL